MARLRLLWIYSALCLGGLMLTGSAVLADPVNPFLSTSASTTLFTFTPCCSELFNGGPGAGNSSIVNGSDSVSATSDPGAAGIGNFGPMGVASSLTPDSTSSTASADYSDAWFCDGHCGVTGVGINTFLSVTGTASDVGNSGGFIELDVDLTIAGNDLRFSYSQDSGDSPGASATVNGDDVTTLQPHAITLTQDPLTGNWSFSLSLLSSLTVCTLADICDDGGPARICGGLGPGCPVPSFSTDESVSLTVDGGNSQLFLDASDPVGFTFTSTAPDTQFFSSSGFQPTAPTGLPVPEPSGLAILVAGLAGLVALRGRQYSSRP